MELVALLRAGNVVIVNEATTIEVFLIGSLSFVQLSGREGGVMDCETPSPWFWGMPAWRNMGRMDVCCQSNRPCSQSRATLTRRCCSAGGLDGEYRNDLVRGHWERVTM